MTPLILLPGKLTTDANGVRGDSFSTGRLYSQAIAQAGGVALQVPPVAQSVEAAVELVSRFDGVIIQGGGDIDPSLYGQTQISSKIYGISAEHDALEMAIVRAAIEQNKPVLAICRGMQILNVALGGTLHQDLGEVLEDGEAHWNTYHEIVLTADSRVARAMKTTSPKRSHSFHHQALDKVAHDLIVTGRAEDNTVEAVEHASAKWIVGVQWHPEDDAKTEPDQQKLFDGFIDAVRSK
ncbi:MAG: gamma-glutamyl-gamma-aminobutyrate hydrolase family protein [Actinobacteria bacterium]|nr:gamma-glutamyl-gamma-aminobutyrate hydrolase family protein [Actinomycetota bacterium]